MDFLLLETSDYILLESGDKLILEGDVTLNITDGTTTYDFLTGVLRLRYQGWDMQGPPPEGDTTLQGYGASFKFTGYQPITETFELIAAAAATNLAIRQEIAVIDKLLEQARRWHAQRSTYISPVYVSFNTATEATRRSLVYGGSIVMRSGSGAQPTLSNNDALATLSITRHPLWMDASAVEIQAETALSSCGGYTAALTQTGSAPAMISMRLGIPPALEDVVNKAWIGILDTAHIDRTAFRPLWLAKLGTMNTTPTDYGADVTAVPDAFSTNAVKVDFDTGPHADLHDRFTISLSQIDATPANWPAFHGVYRILCRCMVGDSAPTTVGIQLQWGTTSLQRSTEIIIANTAWEWIDLGECSIPAEGRSSYQANHKFHVFAERLTGTDDLYVDALLLMPAEHLVTLDNMALANVAMTTINQAFVETDYNDSLYCYQIDIDSQQMDVPDVTARDFYFPVYTGGLVVLAAQATGLSSATQSVYVRIQTTARWLHYRDT